MIGTAGVIPASFGADRDWLLRFCQPDAAQALAALFEIEQEVSASLRPELEHSVAHTRLEWWSEEIDRLARGNPRHPACRVLASSALARGMTPPDLNSLIEHVRVDLACVAFLSREELDEHFGSWARSVFRTAAMLALNTRSPEDRASPARLVAEQLAASAGPLVAEIERLRHFSRHAIAGRIYVPLGDPSQSHAPWAARPLGEHEARTVTSRRDGLRQSLRQLAVKTDPSVRPSLRIPLLWMAFVVAPERDGSAFLASLRRTIASWRSAIAVSRGRLPNELT